MQQISSEVKRLNKGPQLLIDRIELDNFKSYGGKKVIGPLDEKMTSVVGPNGSGKSNLIESLLFVFGKKATWMRLKQLNQLIHKKDDQILSHASVEVFFKENINGKYKEFSVKRVVFRNSSSKYYINNNESPQKEVVELLKFKGIDLENNRFLILQGEVEQISLMKPKGTLEGETGFLEYLEDIVGSNQWKDEIVEMDEQYEGLSDQRRLTNDLVRVAQGEVQGLEKDKNKAEEYIQLEQQHYIMQNINTQIQRGTTNQSVIALDEQYKKEKQKHITLLDSHKEVSKKFKQVQSQIETLESRKKKVDEKLVLNKDSQKQKEIDDESLRYAMEKIINKMCQDCKAIEEYKKQEITIQKTMQKLEQEMKVLVYAQETLEKTKEGKEQNFLKVQNDINSKVSVYQKQMLALRKQIDQLKSVLMQKEQLKTQIEQEIQQIEGFDKNNQNKELEQKIEQMEIEQEKRKKTLMNMEISLENIKKIETQFKQQLESLGRQQSQMKNVLNKKEQELDSLNNVREEEKSNSSGLIEQLVSAQERGQLKGIIGRLGDLGAVDKKYDVAVSTCGMQVNNLVVDNQANGQKVLEYCRQERLGKVTVYPLDVMQRNYSKQSEQNFNAPINSIRIFDLIRVQDQAIKSVFYMVFRDTLVVDSLEKATEIGYGMHKRVITLNGELVETSGIMSGGGQKRRGLMKDVFGQNYQSHNGKDQKEQVRQLREQVDIQRQQIQQNQSQQQQIEEKLREVQSDRDKLKGEQRNDKNSYDNNNARIEELKKIQSVGQMNQTRQKDPSGMKEEVIQLEKDILKIKNQMKGIEENQQLVQKEIDQVGGEEYVQIRQAYEQAKKEEDEIDNKQQVCKTSYQLTFKNRNKVKEQLEKSEKDQQIFEDKKQKLQQDIQNIEQQMLVLIDEEAELSEMASTILNEVTAHKVDFDEYTKKNREMLNQLDELKTQVNSIKQQLDEDKKKYSQQTDSLNGIREKYRMIRREYKEIGVEPKVLESIIDQNMSRVQVSQSNNQSLNKTFMEDEGMKDQYLEIIQRYEFKEEIPQEELSRLIKMDMSRMLTVNIIFTEEQLEGMQPNLKAIQMYQDKHSNYQQKLFEQNNMITSIDSLRKTLDSLKKKRYDMFIYGFNIINAKLKEVYQLLTETGDAELELIDSLDPFSEGIVFSVRPPKKTWKQMMKLSGGEKTLSSLAFIFALHYFKPTPLYFMDEIDAALDYRNVAIVAKYIKERAQNAQFIIISLRNHMFEIADRLVGIYKTYDVTKTIMYQPNPICKEKVESNKNSLHNSQRKTIQ